MARSRGQLGLPVPPAGPGVCALCHGPARDGRPVCWCCRAVSASLGPETRPAPIVVPVALCRTGDPLHAVLRGYKDARVVAARRHFRTSLGAHLARFLSIHDRCITGAAGSTWDSVAIVPSAARTPRGSARVGAHAVEHPLGEVVRSVPCLSGLGRVDLRTGRGSADHLAPSPDAFEVGDGARGGACFSSTTRGSPGHGPEAQPRLSTPPAPTSSPSSWRGAASGPWTPPRFRPWRNGGGGPKHDARDGWPSWRPSCALAGCRWARPG